MPFKQSFPEAVVRTPALIEISVSIAEPANAGSAAHEAVSPRQASVSARECAELAIAALLREGQPGGQRAPKPRGQPATSKARQHNFKCGQPRATEQLLHPQAEEGPRQSVHPYT